MKVSNIDLSSFNTYLDPFENILFYFLNNQNLLLCYLYKANNKLTKLLNDYITILDSLSTSLNYINNIEKIPANSVDVQTSILLSKGGADSNIKDKLFAYASSFQDFKTTSTTEIKESNIDSSENIYAAISYLEQINTQIIELVTNISMFPPNIDFKKLRLTLLDKLLATIQQTDSVGTKQSPISTLINLISSFSFYESSIENYDVYAPIVSKTLPKDLNIYAKTEKNAAIASSNPAPQNTTHSSFDISLDGNTYNISFPSFLSKGRQYMLGTGTIFTVPVNTRLYFQFNSTPLPHNRFVTPEGILVPTGVIPIDIPSGTLTLSTLISVLNAGFKVFDTSFTLRQFANAGFFSGGSDRLVIYGNTFVDGFSIISPPGFYNTGTSTYTSTNPSCNEELNLPLSNSKNPMKPDYRDLLDCIKYYIPNISLELDVLKITSTNQGEAASITFSSSISTDIGFNNYIAASSSVSLYSDTDLLNPNSLGLMTGFKAKDANGEHLITVTNSISYDNIPNLDIFNIDIYIDLVDIVKKILLNIKFTNKHADVLNIIKPIINKPTVEQINVAKNNIPQIKEYYQSVLTSLTSTALNSTTMSSANNLLTYLEQKGYTKLIDYLNKSAFIEFFSAVQNQNNLSFNQALADSISNTTNN